MEKRTERRLERVRADEKNLWVDGIECFVGVKEARKRKREVKAL